MAGGENLEKLIDIQEEMEKNEDKAVNIIKEGEPDKVDNAVSNNQSLHTAEKELNDIPGYTPFNLQMQKKEIGYVKVHERKEPLPPRQESYSKSLLNIRDMISGESGIPEKYVGEIKKAIDNLGEFQTIKIIGCTDASPINTPDAIEKNKSQFDETRKKYIALGGICPTYEELLKSPQDPQNTILGYTRAMEGVLSLHLNAEQIKKVEIGNRLGTNKDDASQRGFDVETQYTKEVVDFIKGSIYESVYRIFGELSKEHIGRYTKSVTNQKYYAIDKLQFSTQGKFEKIYQDVYWGVKNIVGDQPGLEEKVRKQTEDYLKQLIHVCGGEYGNGTWSSEVISNKMFYMIQAVDEKNGFLSQEEFYKLTKEGDVSVIGKKTLSTGESVESFVKNKSVIGADVAAKGLYYYYVPENHPLRNKPMERKLGEANDVYKIMLYLSFKNS